MRKSVSKGGVTDRRSHAVPGRGSFSALKKTLLSRQPLDDDNNDEFEYGDANHNYDQDPSDFSMHQYLVADDARGVAGADSEDTPADDNDDDGASAEVERSQAEASDDDFNSEDTPEDSLIAMRKSVSKGGVTDRRSHAVPGRGSFSALKKSLLSRQPLDDDNNDEFEYGDANHNHDQDPSDFSMHQYLVADDARGVAGADSEDTPADDNDDDGAAAEVERSQAEADDDDFNSEDPPEDSLVAMKKSVSKRQPMEDDDNEEFEYGDANHNHDEDPSDFSMHQYLVADDARGVS